MTLKARLETAANSFYSVPRRVDETSKALLEYQSQPKELQVEIQDEIIENQTNVFKAQFTDLVDRIFSWQGWGMHDAKRGSEDYKGCWFEIYLLRTF